MTSSAIGRTICNRARALYALARYQEALSDYETALQLKADLPDTASDMSIVLENMGQECRV